MEITAKSKHLRVSPRKARLVIDAVRGLNVNDALSQLKFINKKVTVSVEKVIKSAIANAEHNYELDRDNLYVKEIRVDEGATLKRWMPRAHGRATTIRKRTSHIVLKLAEIKDSGKKKAKKQKIEDPIDLSTAPNEDKKAPAKKKTATKKADSKKAGNSEEIKEINDPRMEGRGGHTKIEGKGGKGFANKIFRRKSG